MENISLCKLCKKVDNSDKFLNNNLCKDCFEDPKDAKKVCLECGIEKLLKLFYKNKSAKDGRKKICIDCNISKYSIKKQELITEIDNNYCKEFFKEKIIKTENKDDKIILTNLYKNYKDFIRTKGLKCEILPKNFKIIMEDDKFLGIKYGNSWKGFKII